MTQPQILAVFADAAADPRFPIALGIAALAGLVRGFTGFGSALIYMPLVSAVYSPQIAEATLLLIDSISSLPVSIRAIPQCNWREVTPVTIAGAVAVSRQADDRSFGRGSARSPGSAGAAQIGAPPLLIYWLGGQNSAATVRANIMVYFIMQGALSMIAYLYSALFTTQAVVLSVLLSVPFAVFLTIGARWFHGTSDELYRRVAYIIIAIAGLISLPVFDGLR